MLVKTQEDGAACTYCSALERTSDAREMPICRNDPWKTYIKRTDLDEIQVNLNFETTLASAPTEPYRIRE